MKTPTDEEILQQTISAMNNGTLEVRRRAALIFDKRFPNPDTCHVCGSKNKVKSAYHHIREMTGKE